MPEIIQNPPLIMCPRGDSAVEIQFGSNISRKILNRIRAVAEVLEQQPFTGLIEYVPGFATLTVYYDPWVISQQGKLDAYEVLTQKLEVLVELVQETKSTPARVVELPVLYGGKYGPDLDEVAKHTGISAEEIVYIHSSGEYLVHMVGFAPGFPYLGGMDERLATPRKSSPRASIPAGSIGIAGAQTGVYPISTPGGWQLIGQTPLNLFSSTREVPSLLQAGDKVRFIPISEDEYEARKEGQE